MAFYKGYKNNNYGHNTQHNQNDRSDRNHESQDRRNYDNDNIFDPIIKYLKNPENGDEYSLFSMDGFIYKTFSNMNGGSQIRKFYNSVVEITDQYNKMEVAKGKLAKILPIIYFCSFYKVPFFFTHYVFFIFFLFILIFPYFYNNIGTYKVHIFPFFAFFVTIL